MRERRKGPAGGPGGVERPDTGTTEAIVHLDRAGVTTGRSVASLDTEGRRR